MFNSSTNRLLFDLIIFKPNYLIASLILSLINTFLNILGTTLLIPILYSLLNQQEQIISLKLPLITTILVWVTDYRPEYQLVIMIASIFLIILGKNIFNYISLIINFKHTKDLTFYLKNRGLILLRKVDLNYYQKNKNGDITTKFNRETEKTALTVKSLQKLLIISLIIILLTVILSLLSWQLTLVSLILITTILVLNNWVASQTRDSKITTLEKSQQINLQIIEFLTGIHFIKTVANESKASKAIAQSLKEKDRLQLNTQLIIATIPAITEIGGMVVILILIITSYYLSSQTTSEIFPALLLYLAIICRLIPFISQFNSARLQFSNTRSSVAIVANFLTETNKPISASGNITFSYLQTGIEFKAVTFAYPQQAQIILDKISFSIPQGKTIALVGFSELEKSILADLLTRLYQPIEGQILFDGKELQEYDTYSLRKAIAIISSNTFLFNKSLAENIAYGATNASHLDIINAAKKAEIWQFINQLPAGLETQVGRGLTLSEYQKQKISIARAWLRDPKILIVDEPITIFSAKNLDPDSIPSALETFCRERTTLIITKQLHLAQQADQIVMFNQGKIIEAGTHQQLLEQGDLYPRLYSKQFKINQQSRQLKLAQKIAQKLYQQSNDSLSLEIRNHLNTLLKHLDVINSDLFNDEQSQNKILDESYQSAQDMLASLKEYERKISRGFNSKNL